MSKQSAGILMFRRKNNDIEVLLVHPGGPYFKKDIGVWSIPKGLIENEDLLETAKREFQEELGFPIANDSLLVPLSPIKQKGGKEVFAWAVEGDLDTNNITSNMFKLEWPPKSGKYQDFPEIDKAEWFPVNIALEKINQGQAQLIRELLERVGADNIPNSGNKE